MSRSPRRPRRGPAPPGVNVKQIAGIVAGVALILTGIVFLISRVADVSPLDSSTPSTDATGSTTTTVSKDQEKAQNWDRDANGAFGGVDLTEHVIDLVKGAQDWQAGAKTTEDFKTTLAARKAEFASVRQRLETLRPYPFDDRVKPLYLDSADLYSQTVDVYAAMVATPGPGDVRTQLDLLARRVRELADRVFDRGHELVKPKLGEQPNPDVDVRLPEEVPDWVAEGLAPGPPLDDKPPPPSTEPQLHQATRPEQARSDWLAALRRLDLPGPRDEAKAVDAHDDGALRADARALVAAAESLRKTPDPKGEREEATRIRLSLLVDADAARAAQLHLDAVARRLLLVGDQLWSGKDLPERSSGLDPALLKQD